jgi:hypothetical protein
MPGRPDCLFTGRGRIRHRTADDGRCRSASSVLALSMISAASTTSDTVPTQ